MSSSVEDKKKKEEEDAEIKKNIEALKNRFGDARTGGKGSQRRKIKVVNKNIVISLINLRVEIKLLKVSLKKLVHNNLVLIKSIFLKMIIRYSISQNQKSMLLSKIAHSLLQANLKPKI
jgi:hypothetical protein